MEFGIGREPLEWRIDVEVGELGLAFCAFSGEPFDIVAVNRNWSGANRAEFTDAEAGRSGDGRTAGAPG